MCSDLVCVFVASTIIIIIVIIIVVVVVVVIVSIVTITPMWLGLGEWATSNYHHLQCAGRRRDYSKGLNRNSHGCEKSQKNVILEHNKKNNNDYPTFLLVLVLV